MDSNRLENIKHKNFMWESLEAWKDPRRRKKDSSITVFGGMTMNDLSFHTQ